jgi:hypothetical protein
MLFMIQISFCYCSSTFQLFHERTTKFTSGNDWESADNVGASALQGEHHDAQTFTTAIFFSVKSNLVPYKVLPLSFGASWRSAGEIKVTAPFPDM